MYLAAVEEAVPWCPLTAKIMRPCRYHYESRRFSKGNIVHVCVGVCVSMKL